MSQHCIWWRLHAVLTLDCHTVKAHFMIALPVQYSVLYTFVNAHDVMSPLLGPNTYIKWLLSNQIHSVEGYTA